MKSTPPASARRWVVVGSLVAALASFAYSSLVCAPSYRAELRLLVSPHPDTFDASDRITSRVLEGLEDRWILGNCAEALQSRRLQRDAVSDRPAMAAVVERYSFSAVVVPRANVVELWVEGESREKAIEIADAVGESVADYIGSRHPFYRIEVLDTAYADRDPVQPRAWLHALAAFAICMIGGLLLLPAWAARAREESTSFS